MKRTKVIHCRLTEDEHKMVVDAAKSADMSITQFVISAAHIVANKQSGQP